MPDVSDNTKLIREIRITYCVSFMIVVSTIVYRMHSHNMGSSNGGTDTISEEDWMNILITIFQGVGIFFLDSILCANYSWVPSQGNLDPRDVAGSIIRALFIVQLIHAAWHLATTI